MGMGMVSKGKGGIGWWAGGWVCVCVFECMSYDIYDTHQQNTHTHTIYAYIQVRRRRWWAAAAAAA